MSKLDKNIQLKKNFISALEKSMGIISTACKQAGICRATYYDWINKDDNFRAEVNNVYEYQIDFVESQLLKNISNQSDTAIIFYLKTKGAKRGYCDRKEIDLSVSIDKEIQNAALSFIEMCKQKD